MPTSIEEYAPMDVNDFFNQHVTHQSKDAVDPLVDVFGLTGQPEPERELYDVEVVPSKEGALSLGLPVLRSKDKDPFEELGWGADIPDHVLRSRVEDPDVKPNLCSGVSVHMGYRPISEEEAFVFPVSSVKVLHPSHFTIPRGQMTVEKIIDRIRKVVFSTDDINEIAPKNTHFDTKEHTSSLYGSKLVYTTFDQYGNHRFAQFYINLIAIESPAEIAVLVTHIIGDTRLSMEFFLTVRAYVLSNGTTERKVVNPDLYNGFADAYINEMTEQHLNIVPDFDGEQTPDYNYYSDDYQYSPSSPDSP